MEIQRYLVKSESTELSVDFSSLHLCSLLFHLLVFDVKTISPPIQQRWSECTLLAGCAAYLTVFGCSLNVASTLRKVAVTRLLPGSASAAKNTFSQQHNRLARLTVTDAALVSKHDNK
jgi:hypothetical protein